MLTHVADKNRTMHRYILVSDNDDFSKVVNRRVQIEGKVGDRSHGRIEIKTTTKVDGPAKDTPRVQSVASFRCIDGPSF